MLPALCRAGDMRPAGRAAVIVAAPAVAGTALLFASASWSIPLVLGPRYMDAVPAFRILLLAFPLMSVNYVLTHQLIGWHGQGTYAVVCACALAVNLALNRWLIPSAGIDGAAWATVWTEVVVGGGCGLALRRQMTRVAT